MHQPITAIIVGAGHRILVYARYALDHPERLKIVGVADPDAERRRMAQRFFDLPDSIFSFLTVRSPCEPPTRTTSMITVEKTMP